MGFSENGIINQDQNKIINMSKTLQKAPFKYIIGFMYSIFFKYVHSSFPTSVICQITLGYSKNCFTYNLPLGTCDHW